MSEKSASSLNSREPTDGTIEKKPGSQQSSGQNSRGTCN